MIKLDNVPDLGLYISGNNITVAKGNAVTLNFSETDTTCTATVTPSTVSIAGTLLNSTEVTITSDLVCTDINDNSSSTSIYNYEVIDSKVVYERINKSTGIVFRDITNLQTYSHKHDIPTTNNTWLQHINRGAILLEKYDETTSTWNSIGTMLLGGSFTYYSNISKEDNIECKFRSKYILRERANCGGTSPIIFEAQGDEFDLVLRYYEEDNLYIKDIILETGNENKFNLCDQEIDFLSVEVEKQIEIVYDSYNIDYVYNYLESSSSLEFEPIPSLAYDQVNKSILGSIDDLDPRTPTKLVHVEFIGCQNEFIDGQLIVNSTCENGVSENIGDFNCNDFAVDFYTNCADTLNSNIIIESKQLYIEGVRPNILGLTQEDCTYCLKIEDNTIVENPCLKGKVHYQYKLSLDSEWCEFDSIKEILPLSSFINCFCLEV